MKNVIIGRIGITLKFKGFQRGNQTALDTDMILYSTLSQMNPDYNFYFIGPSEFHKLTEKEYDDIFPNHNVFSAWTNDIRKTCNYEKIIKYFTNKNIKIDFALINSGPSAIACVPDFYPRNDGKPRNPLQSSKIYMAPYIYTLNKLNCPLYVVADDVRNILLNFRDLANRERLVFTQTNQILETVTHIKSVDDFTLITDKVKCVYANTERLDIIGMSDNWQNKIDINRKLKSQGEHVIVISHGNGTNKINSNHTVKNGRLPGYKEYIIDGLKGTKYENTKVYGIWGDEIYKQYPNTFENKPMAELEDILLNAKYTLVYSQTENFVTIKPWEMIANGLIPFIHPEYDPEHILGLPEYVYLKDANDFKNKIIELDNNDELYLNVLKGCMNCIRKEDRDGTYINNFILGTIANDLGYTYQPKTNIDIKFNNCNNMHI